jgi:hypothetical protein
MKSNTERNSRVIDMPLDAIIAMALKEKAAFTPLLMETETGLSAYLQVCINGSPYTIGIENNTAVSIEEY